MKHKNINYSTLLDAFRYGRPGKYLSFLLVFVFLYTLGGCYYYKIVTSAGPPAEVISAQQEADKFIILHSKYQVLKFSDIQVNDDTIAGKISPLLGHEYYKTARPEYANRYKVSVSPEKDESEVINEVHITISGYNVAEGNEILIPLENIEKIEIYNKAIGSTSATFVLVAVPIVFVLIIGLWLLSGPAFS
jgi:hypothetical protein